MQPTPPSDRGLSLDELKGAFAQMLGKGGDPYTEAPEPVRRATIVVPPPEDPTPDEVEVTPLGIVEAMLFVGLANAAPLSAERMSSLMRGVRPTEVDDLVRELNDQYARNGCPYTIRSVGDGYCMRLCEEFDGLHAKMLGRARQARLSRAAIEVLSLAAYRGPMTGEAISKLRGAPSNAVIAQLVRRKLLKLERPEPRKRPVTYRVTDRFLQLFGLASLDDLPRSQEV
jgi:segregation and condensation protein B